MPFTIPETIDDGLISVMHDFKAGLETIKFRKDNNQAFSESDIEFITERVYNPKTVQKLLKRYNIWLKKRTATATRQDR